MNNFDDMKFAVESISGGMSTVKLDDIGMPSILCRFPSLNSDEVITGATQDVHSAFSMGGVQQSEVAVSKYLNVVRNSRAYSLPMQDPAASLSFDSALAYCKNKGEGWGVTPASLWSAIALWCKKNGTMPRGNTNYGRSHEQTHEKGIASYTYDDNGTTRIGRTATGSGPATWNHNWQLGGISDLCGNVWEWCAGLRLVKGEIQIIPYANCMIATCDMGVLSTEWKAIKSDGSLITPDGNGTTTDSLKLDYVDSKWQITTAITSQEDSSRYCSFKDMTIADGITVPQIVKELILYPADADGYDNQRFYANNGADERFLFRGGSWYGGDNAGVFASYLYNPRSYVNTYFGFRSAFYGEL